MISQIRGCYDIQSQIRSKVAMIYSHRSKVVMISQIRGGYDIQSNIRSKVVMISQNRGGYDIQSQMEGWFDMQSQIKGGYADFLDKLCLYSLLSSEELVFNFQNCKLPKTIEQFLYNPRIFFFFSLLWFTQNFKLCIPNILQDSSK